MNAKRGSIRRRTAGGGVYGSRTDTSGRLRFNGALVDPSAGFRDCAHARANGGDLGAQVAELSRAGGEQGFSARVRM